MGVTVAGQAPWLEKALQGLAFWIGYRRALFNHQHILEAALTAELCNLIQSGLPDGLVLIPEVAFARLARSRSMPRRGRQCRADLVVCEGRWSALKASRELSGSTRMVIEVKRARAQPSLIDRDLKRLASVKKALPEVKAVLVVVSEGIAPKRFVVKGKSRLGRHEIAGLPGYHYRVRRTCKAAASFSVSSMTSQHYVCLLEVLPNKANSAK